MTKSQVENTHTSGSFSKSSLFTKIRSKSPLFRGSHFNIYFRLECQENRGSRQNFHEIPFSKDRVLINSDHVTFQFLFQNILCINYEKLRHE